MAQLAQAVPLLEAMRALTYRRFLSTSATSKSSRVLQLKPVGAFPDSPSLLHSIAGDIALYIYLRYSETARAAQPRSQKLGMSGCP